MLPVIRLAPAEVFIDFIPQVYKFGLLFFNFNIKRGFGSNQSFLLLQCFWWWVIIYIVNLVRFP